MKKIILNMKNIFFLIIILFSSDVYSQNKPESSLICQSIDELSGKKSIMCKRSLFLKGNLSDSHNSSIDIDLMIREENKKIKILTVWLKVFGINDCVDQGNTLDIIFENEKKIQLVNWKKFNCDGVNYFFIDNREELFKKNKIKSIEYTNIKTNEKILIEEFMSNKKKSYIKNVLQEIDKINNGLIIPCGF